MSSAAARNEIQSLYRSYLRLIADWPTDRVRPNRDMKQVLTARVQEMFRQKDNGQVDVEQARRQLDALERLLANEFKEKVRRLDIERYINIPSILTPVPCSILLQTKLYRRLVIQTITLASWHRLRLKKQAKEVLLQGSLERHPNKSPSHPNNSHVN